MKRTIAFSILGLLSLSFIFILYKEKGVIKHCAEELHHIFDEFKLKFKKKYLNENEEQYRKSIFHLNLHLIEKLRYKYQDAFSVGVNEFSDLTQEEFNALYKGFKPLKQINSSNEVLEQNSKTQKQDEINSNLRQNRIKNEEFTESQNKQQLQSTLDSIDWREKNAVTSVKHQGKCEGCWAFSAIGGLEGAAALKTGKLQDFSVQQIIDCQRIEAVGCHGGDIEPAYKYAKNFGIQLEKDYPFVEKDNQDCKYEKSIISYKPENVTTTIQNSGIKIKELLNKQPVSICLNSNQESFTHYTGGIYEVENCSTIPDHCVLLVGYGVSSDNKKYWIIKNSWGESWGEKGYMRILRNEDETAGMCGVTAYAMVPII